jgi:hypothetical protein
LTFLILKNELKADIVWQDKNYMGLRFADAFNVVQLIKALTKRIKEPEIKPKKIIQDNAIASFANNDVLSFCINLMAELENTETNITQLKIYVQEISDICNDPLHRVRPEETGEIEYIEESAPAEPEGLAEILISAANTALASKGSRVSDLDFAIARLGRDTVKKISTDFLR